MLLTVDHVAEVVVLKMRQDEAFALSRNTALPKGLRDALKTMAEFLYPKLIEVRESSLSSFSGEAA